MFGQSSKSVPKSGLLPPGRGGGVNARVSSDQIFQIAVISEYLYSLVEISSVTTEIKRRKKKKERKKPQRLNITHSASRCEKVKSFEKFQFVCRGLFSRTVCRTLFVVAYSYYYLLVRDSSIANSCPEKPYSHLTVRQMERTPSTVAHRIFLQWTLIDDNRVLFVFFCCRIVRNIFSNLTSYHVVGRVLTLPTVRYPSTSTSSSVSLCGHRTLPASLACVHLED